MFNLNYILETHIDNNKIIVLPEKEYKIKLKKKIDRQTIYSMDIIIISCRLN